MSGELADFERAIVVTEEHVKKARVLGEDRTMDSIISQLPLQSKCVLMGCLYIVLFEPPNVKLETGVIYSRYQEIARLIGVETLTQRRVTDLISELDMVGVVACKIESKGRFGRTKSVTLNIDAKKTWSIVVQNEKCLENIQDVMVKRRLTFGNFG
jgi:cell division control protein 6